MTEFFTYLHTRRVKAEFFGIESFVVRSKLYRDVGVVRESLGNLSVDYYH